jgi:hypothetical protein
MTVSPEYIRAGLIARGMAPHHAEGFVMNFGDESGFDPGINEADPMVTGSRGGFGLYQVTGPRRVAFERFAAGRGKAASDVDTQLDFLMTELRGPEANAAKAIFAAPDARSAAIAIASQFLRPAKANLDKRVAKYGGAAAPRDRQGVAPIAAAYVNGRMTPEDAALYEQGMADGTFPKVSRRADPPAPEQPDPLQPLADLNLRRFRFGNMAGAA